MEGIELNEKDIISSEIEEGFDKLIKSIEERCKKSNIEFGKYSDSNYYEIKLNSAREQKSIIIYDCEDAEDILSIDFEEYSLFNEYEGIYSYSKGIIESYIETYVPPQLVKRRLFGSKNNCDEICVTVEQLKEFGDLKIIIGDPSKEICCLTANRFRRLTIRIEGVDFKEYSKVCKVLENISNSVFFQIDLEVNIPLMLLTERRPKRGMSPKRMIDIKEVLKFPNTVYDSEAISLYWYARNSNGIPLLQFLAFYQSIEFYFPVYSEKEAKRAIKNILKNPTFNPNNEIDLTKVLTTIKSRVGKNFENERNQIKATLKECINIDELRNFLSKNKFLMEFYSDKDYKKLSKSKISVKLSDEELINNISERIYDIRCKIVHTKASENEGEIDLLLPFAKEVKFLYYDIELIKYISQQIIIFNSKSLSFI
ncbi:hypothetical protein [Clostridium tertium]